MFSQATFGMPDPMPEDFFPSRRGYLRIGAIIGSLAAVLILFVPLGFRVTMFGFFLFLLTALSRHRLVVSVPVALLGSFGIYQVFTSFLEIPLPIGIFGI